MSDGLKAWNEAAIREQALSCTLHNCIDTSELQDFEWMPVGEGISSSRCYTGTFTGNAFIVSNLVIELSGSIVGFFEVYKRRRSFG